MSVTEVLVIDGATRQINVPSSQVVFGVVSDANADRKYFIGPRYVGNNLDLSTCFIRINYRNANGEIDAHIIDDVSVTDDGNKITFSWELTPKVTRYKGQITFVVCACKPNANGTLANEWNTTIAKGIVLEGLEPTNVDVTGETNDVITQLITMVDKQIGNVEQAAERVRIDVEASVEQKGINTLASIPNDYTSLTNAVDALNRSRAGVIVCEKEGSVITLDDASDLPLQGLRVFGGNNVRNPELTVCGKNLLNRNYDDAYQVISGIKYEHAGNGKVTLTGTATNSSTFLFAYFTPGKRTFIPAGTYTVSGNPSSDMQFGFYLYDTQESEEFTQANGRIMGDIPWTFTIEKDKYYGAYLYVPAGKTVSTTISPQVEIGNKFTSYEPPSGETLKFTSTLRGVHVTSDGNYTDITGQSWICDEVDFARGVYVQRINADDSSILEIPVETPLTDTEINTYRALHSNKPNTTIMNDAGAHMSVSYAADTKLYINKAIKEALL